MTIGLIATLKVQAGKGGEFEAAFKDLQQIVKSQEPGCLQYELFRLKDDAETYLVYEQYADQAALGAHAKSDEGKAGMKKMGGFLAGAPTIQLSEKIT